MSFFKNLLEGIAGSALYQQEKNQEFRNAHHNAIAEMEKHLRLLKETGSDKKQIRELENMIREMKSYGV